MAKPYAPPNTRSNPPGTIGAPLAINRVLETRETGDRYTVADRIIQVVALGEHPRIAAASAGISLESLVDSAQAGAKLSYNIERGARREDALTPREQAELAFSRRLSRALADGQTRHATLRNQLMNGGTQLVTKTTTTRKVGDQIEITTVEKVETLGPDGSMLRWHAERRWPQEFGNRLNVLMEHGDGADPLSIPVQDRIGELLAAADEWRAGQGQIVDVTTTDPTDG